jgi:protein-histidine pros-kinase
VANAKAQAIMCRDGDGAVSEIPKLSVASDIDTVLELVPDAMVVVDRDGRIRAMNSLVETLLEYTRDELIGQPVEVLLPRRFAASHPQHRRDFADKPRTRAMGTGMELAARAKSGKEIPVEVSLRPAQGISGMTVCAAIRDVTERHLIHRALENARATAEQASARNARFLAIASHDLRQPVQALTMLLAAARMSGGQTNGGELWQRIDETMRSLSEMLDALLNMTKIESGKVALKVEVVALSDLLRPVKVEMSLLAAQRGLTLAFQYPALAVSTDTMLFQQVLRNLIGNAIKYTDRGGVWVECAERAERVLISVRDTGIGIPEAALANVFGEFQQFRDDNGRTRGGVGLGLWIVRRLADQLGIEIQVESQLGQGTTFTIDLPKAVSPRAQNEAVAAPRAKLRGASSKRILLVDDDETVRYATTVFLSLQGFHVVGATTLSEARDAVVVDRERFDLIISDFHLINNEFGVDAIKFARSYYQTTLPAIVVSGDTSQAIGEFKSWEHTVFLNKPVDADHLVHAIHSLLADP